MRPTWLIESGVAADLAQRSWEAASTAPVMERGSFMHRKIPAITILICGLVLLSGCRTPTTLPPAAEPASTHPSAAMTDAAVLQVVFDDMLSKDNAESPVEWHGDPVAPVYVSKNPRRWPTNASEIFSHRDESKCHRRAESHAGVSDGKAGGRGVRPWCGRGRGVAKALQRTAPPHAFR